MLGAVASTKKCVAGYLQINIELELWVANIQINGFATLLWYRQSLKV